MNLEKIVKKAIEESLISKGTFDENKEYIPMDELFKIQESLGIIFDEIDKVDEIVIKYNYESKESFLKAKKAISEWFNKSHWELKSEYLED